MSQDLTFDGLAVPLRVLRLLAADFGHLPAPHIDVSTVFPDRLQLRFHGSLTAFETWRDALGIAPDTVAYHEQCGDTRVLMASVDYAGAVLELVGYGDLPAPALAGTAA
ncbi:hypothetical protein AB0O05_09455 [Streptomyces sp. NPDC093084]|uniref:hypothetical protein n=1 Tax=Streptomyces sp. NPDC093084 TaxID=3155197 RepID=UPI0034267928